MPRSDAGWSWFQPTTPPAGEDAGLDLARQTARLFASGDGQALLAHLKGLTLDRCLGPDSGDAALRHLEGQRHLVLHILSLAARGHGGV
jgi:hypothetical protein